MLNQTNQPPAAKWEKEFWKYVEQYGNGSNVDFCLKLRDFIRQAIAKALGAKKQEESNVIDKIGGFIADEAYVEGDDEGFMVVDYQNLIDFFREEFNYELNDGTFNLTADTKGEKEEV
jgi:hypothetical protein